MQIVLIGVRLFHPGQNLDMTADILIENGIIKEIKEKSGSYGDAVVYDLTGKYCVPGLFDMHVHLREPGREDAETVFSGCNAAAAGGFTGVACMPNTTPTIDSAEIVRFIIEKAEKHLVDVYPIGAVSVDRAGEILAPIAELAKAGAVAFSDDGAAVKTAQLFKKGLEYAHMYGKVIIEHCEDPTLADGVMNEGINSTILGLPPLPTLAEDLTIARDIQIAKYTGGRVHIAHISSKNGIELVREAKKQGVNITAEVTPHHFTLTDDFVKNYDTNFKMNPPLRTQEDVEAAIEGLKDGTIDCIASDHAPHTIEDKDVEFIYAPNGILGLETQLGLTLSELYHKKHLSLKEVIEKLSINPRKILGLQVPEIKEGAKAELTVFDPDEVWKVDVTKFKSLSKNSPFHNRLLTGKQTAVINNSAIYIDGEFKQI